MVTMHVVQERITKMKITRSHIRSILKEALFTESKEMLPIIVSRFENFETMNRIANYALTNDIKGALSDSSVNHENLDLDLDEMKGLVKYVGDGEDRFTKDSVVPDNWNADKVYKFIKDLETAWLDSQGAASDSKHKSDPGVKEREVIGNSLTMDYIDFDDIKNITYQIRKTGGVPVRIDIDYSDPSVGGVDYANITADQIKRAGLSITDIEEILSAGKAKLRKKSPPVQRTPSMYD